jgi:PKD domain/Matrixin
MRRLAGVAAVGAAMLCWCTPAVADMRIDAGAARIVDGDRAHASFRVMHRWPSRTIAYHNTVRKYAKQVQQAAALWNGSGSRVRWKAVPRSRARVIVKIDDRIPYAGMAPSRISGGSARGSILLRSNLLRGWRGPGEARAVVLQVIVHEMGHIMGFDHEDRRCAIMNSLVGLKCRDPKKGWRYRCRALERDDIRGAVRLYGGRPGKPGREFCDLAPAPPAVGDLAVTPSDEGPVLSWRNTARKGVRLDVVRGEGGKCPTGLDDGDFVASVEVRAPGTTGSLQDSLFDLGEYCWSVIPTGAFERPGKVASVRFTHRGSPPTAAFEAFQWDALTVDFADQSTDPDYDLVSWSWSFGDGATSTQVSPTHVYAAPGSYTVTLTVTDGGGSSATTSQVVAVE